MIVPNLMVSDMARSVRFYRDTLGMTSTMTVSAASLGIEISEAFQFEPESVPGRPFVLDAVRLDNVEQTLADHGDHEVSCRKDAQRPIGTPRLYRRSAVINCQYVPPMYRHGDGRALSCS